MKYSKICGFLNCWLLRNEGATKRHLAIYSKDYLRREEPLLNSSVPTYKYAYIDL